MRVFLLGIILLFTFVSTMAQGTVVADSASGKKKSYIRMLHTDVTRFDEKINPDAWILVGNVRFRRDSMYMYCDSAHYYQKKNAFQAFGNVRMEQGDTLFIYGDVLYYDGTEQLAELRHNVRLINRNVTLTTDSLNYDMTENIGYYFAGGSIVDEKN